MGRGLVQKQYSGPQCPRTGQRKALLFAAGQHPCIALGEFAQSLQPEIITHYQQVLPPAWGFWSPAEAELHITFRELRAVRRSGGSSGAVGALAASACCT